MIRTSFLYIKTIQQGYLAYKALIIRILFTYSTKATRALCMYTKHYTIWTLWHPRLATGGDVKVLEGRMNDAGVCRLRLEHGLDFAYNALNHKDTLHISTT